MSPHFLTIIAAAPATEWEPPGIILLKLLTVLFLVLLNGFFVASEFAIVKVRGSQLDALEAHGSKRVKLARHVGQLHFHKLRDTAGTGSG